MRKLFLILSFILTLFYLCQPIYAQTHSWVQIDNNGVTAGTGFVQNQDSVYYFDGNGGGIFRLYKGFNSVGAYLANGAFRGVHTSLNYYYLGANIFFNNNSLYSFREAYWYDGYYYNRSGLFTSYNLGTSVATVLANLGSTYFSDFNCLDQTAIIGDTLYTILMNVGYSYPFSNNLVKYSFTSNVWNPSVYSGGVTIPQFDNQPGKAGMSIITGVFNLGDTLYAVSSYGYGDNSHGLVAGVYDTIATVWRRNPTAYTWDSLKSFSHAGILLAGQTLNNKEYLLFASNDSSNTTAGLWKFDGINFTQLLKPPSQYRVIGFYMSNPNEYFESIANSAVPDSNKLYYYNGVKWDTGQVIYSSTEAKNILINNISTIGSTVFVGSRILIPGAFATGAKNTVAYDTNYYYASILNPTGGELYNIGDSVKVKISSNFTDTIKVFISYANSVYDSVGFLTTADSLYILPDTTSANAQIKITDLKYGVTVYSNTFKIYPARYLEIDSVYFYTGLNSKVNLITTHSGVTQLSSYYSADSLAWQFIGSSSVDLTLGIDTLSYLMNFPMLRDGYYKVMEVKDTVVYGLTTPVVSEVGFLDGPSTICYSFAYHGLGVSWSLDPGCQWVNTITKYFAIKTLSVGSDGILSTTGNYTSYPFPYTGMPDYKVGAANGYSSFNSSSPFIYGGREFWFQTVSAGYSSYYQLWMKDLVNNVSYAVATVGASYGTAGIFSDGNVQAASSGGYLLFSTIFGYPTVFDIAVSPYPYDPSKPAISAVYHATGIGSQAFYRNYFRGIDPKMVKHE